MKKNMENIVSWKNKIEDTDEVRSPCLIGDLKPVKLFKDKDNAKSMKMMGIKKW